MIHRSRTLVALFALLALSAFLVDSAWALACSPRMAECGAGMEMCADEAAASAHSGDAAAAHHSSPTTDHTQGAPSDAHPCPMALMSGGCVVAALPAPTVLTQTVVAQTVVVLPSLDQTPDLLVVAGHFRPPRA